jgi:Imelysin
MTPTMSEYFEAWKNSRFVSGSKASEQAFVATSRLSDIADILEGLVFTYDGVEPLVAEADPQQARQTEQSLASLHDFAAGLRDKEEAGRMYSAEEADTLGSRAQQQAEAIAGQITQAAARLNVEIEEG